MRNQAPDTTGPSAIADPRRLAALARSALLDTPPEDAFDRLTRLAARLLDAPVALVSLVGHDRQFFKSAVGLAEPWASRRQTPLSHSFCQHVVAARAPLAIGDARQDPLFRDNPAIEDFGVAAYLGVPLTTPSGQVLGSFCVIDERPRQWSEREVELIADLAASVMTEIEARALVRQVSRDLEALKASEERLRQSEERFRALVQTGSDIITILTVDGTIRYESPSTARLLGYRPEELAGRSAFAFVHPDDVERVAAAFAAVVATPGVGVPLEFRFRHADGSWRYLEAIGTNLLQTPAVGGIVVNSRDITERKALESSLAAHTLRLEELVAIRTGELEASRLEMLERLALAAEYRDDVTGEHTRRVGRLTARLAGRLGVPAGQIALLERAAPLHDVGKIGIADQILLKPGRLDPSERAVMETHTTIGARILGDSSSPTLRLAAEIALTHHERWDGTGYPRGLAGETIPLSGRIVAVADVFDALIQARPYKAAWPVEAALAELRRERGRQFDQAVVDALLALERERGLLDRPDDALASGA